MKTKHVVFNFTKTKMNIKIEIDLNGNIIFMPKTKKQVLFMREWFKKYNNELNKMEYVDAMMCVPDKYVIDEDK